MPNLASPIAMAMLTEKNMNETIEVLIIGAGIAGLSAGQKLLRHGYEVRIIESRDRIGGRVFPRQIGANLLDSEKANKFPVVTVECGANWIHGLESSNPMYRIAMKEKFELVESTGDDSIDMNAMIADRSHYSANGTPKIYSKQDLQGASDHFMKLQHQLSHARWKISKKRAAVRTSTTPRDVLLRIQSENAAITDSEQHILDWLYEQQGIAEAKDFDMIRFTSWWDVPDDAEAGEGLVVGGVSQFLPVLSRGLDICLSCEATAIHYPRGDSAACSLPISVVTSQGTISAKHVIVAVPNGVLKHRHIQFYPPLRPQVQQTICSLDSGVLDVVVFRFETQFWPPDVFVFGVPPTKDASATATDKHTPHNGMSTVLHERITRGVENCCDWGGTPLVDCLFSSFMNLTMARTDGCPLLLGQVYGRRALQLETMALSDIAAAAHNTLKILFGPTVPAPIGCEFHKWGLDEMAYGSWNSVAVGASTENAVSFRVPVECQVLHDSCASCLQFAGEWTDPARMGLLQGAYLTGERAADHIVKSHPRKT